MPRIKDLLKWLYPGLGVKRWLLALLVGTALVAFGLALLAKDELLLGNNRLVEWVYFNTGILLARSWFGAVIMLLGLLLLGFALSRLLHTIVDVLRPAEHGQLADLLVRKRFLAHGEEIVALGGGTGLSTLLRGIKEYTRNISAVVTVADDGGSTGRLRRDFGILAPGDLRSCLAALADAEPQMMSLLQYRFDEQSKELEGHALGNLLITALTKVQGNFLTAIQELSKVLAIRGRVLPATLANVALVGEQLNGERIVGESNIPKSHFPIRRVWLEPESPPAAPEVIEALQNAAVIVVGPGSLFTSLLPNLLVAGVTDAIRASEAVRVYVCNVMTQPGETDGFTAADHIKLIYAHTGPGLFDYVLLNSQEPPPELLSRYDNVAAELVYNDLDELRELGVEPVERPLLQVSEVIRHDPAALAEALFTLVDRGRPRPRKRRS